MPTPQVSTLDVKTRSMYHHVVRAAPIVIFAAMVLLPATGAAEDTTPKKTAESRLVEASKNLRKDIKAFTAGLIDLAIDVRKRTARIICNAGDDNNVGLNLRGNISRAGDAAAIDAQLSLSLRGRTFTLELPQIQLAPGSFKGRDYLEVRLPLVRGRF